MMFKLAISIVLIGIAVVRVVNSESYIPNAVHKDYPGMCYHKDTETAIPLGGTFQPTNQCVEIKCLDDFLLRFNHCQRHNIRSGCVVEDKMAPYPSCCPKSRCQ